MKKIALLLLVLLGAGIGYGIACSLSDHFVQQGDDALCASAYPTAYIGVGASSLLLLIITRFLSVRLFSLVPNGFVYDLYKPPRHI